MKDDFDNEKLDQFDSSADMDTPNIPGETEPDTSNDKDSETMPYGTDSSSDDSQPDSPDQTADDNMPDPISDFSPSNSLDSSDPDEANSYDSSSTIMPDFVAPAPVTHTKKSKRSKIILGFMVFVLLLALGGFVYWYYYMQPTDDNTTTPVATQPTEAKTGLSYTDVIKDLKSDTPEKVADSFPKAKTFTVDNTDAPAYKTADSDFYVVAKGDNQTVFVQSDGDKKYTYEKDGIDVNDKYIELNKPITDAFVAYFTENDFKETQTADRDLPLVATVYTNDITACSVSSNEDPASVTCTELANYTKDQATLAPMFTTLQKAEKDTGATTTIMGLTSTKTNQDLGYENAVVGISDVRSPIGGFAGLFYKKTSDKNWAYFTGAQNTLSCNKYDTYAKQAAFEGDPCGDGKTVTVTADKPKKMKAL